MMDWLPDATKSNAKKGAQHDQGITSHLLPWRAANYAAFSYTRYSSRDRAGMEPDGNPETSKPQDYGRARPRSGPRHVQGSRFHRRDLAKPLIGVANTWIETMPCNSHLRELGAKVKQGIRWPAARPWSSTRLPSATAKPWARKACGASLVSRELIADSIELSAADNSFDAVVCVVGCDNTIPAAAMALGALNIPGLILYGGTIRPPAEFKGKDVTIQGHGLLKPWAPMPPASIGDDELKVVLDQYAPAPEPEPAAANTAANTMSTVMELIGLSPMGFNSVPALSRRKKTRWPSSAAKLVMNLLPSENPSGPYT